jgi:hypothetical protein
MNLPQTVLDKQIEEGDLFILLLIESVYKGRDMTFQEVADRLQISRATVQGRYQRAVKRFNSQAAAKLLPPRGPEQVQQTVNPQP